MSAGDNVCMFHGEVVFNEVSKVLREDKDCDDITLK